MSDRPPIVRVSPNSLKVFVAAGVEAADTLVMPAGIAPLELARMRAGFEAALVRIQEAEASGAPQPFAVDHGPTSLLQAFLAERAAEEATELVNKGALEPLGDGGYEAKFDHHDWTGWVGQVFSWWRQLLDKHAFVTPSDVPEARPDLRRIALLGDWGTGLYGAPVCATTIQHQARHDLLLHLGDVYYAGRPKEVEERFLNLWPKVPNALSRAVNSNHEMYAGGHGFFEKTLPAFGQASSCFAIETDHFVLVGLDTGYDEHDLHGGQDSWLDGLVARAESSGRKVVLFSHHQPFSAFERDGAALVAKLKPLLERKAIFAWYWGHEHRMVLYDRHPAWGLYPRLVGHSGFPYFRDDVSSFARSATNSDGSAWYRVERPGIPGALLLDGDNVYVGEDPARYGPQGFMSLEIDGGSIHETVHAPDGTVLREQTIA
jgi:hypothetical protein